MCAQSCSKTTILLQSPRLAETALFLKRVPAGSLLHGGDVAVYVLDINQFLVSISVFMALSTVFHSINPPDNSLVFSLCSSRLISASLVLSTTYLFMKVYLG